VERGVKEYAPPASNLPMQITAAESKRHNCDWQAQTPWDAETEAAPILAGTRSGTPSTTPVSDGGAELGEAIAEGDVPGVVNAITEPIKEAANLAGSAAMLAE
jgi:hypothetical protein